MKNQIKYNLYLLRKSKFPWIILIFLSLFTFAVHFANHLQYSGIIDLEPLKEGAYLYPSTSLLDIILDFYYSDKITLFIGIFVATYTLIEFDTGFIKSIYDPFLDKSYKLKSYILISSLYVLISFVLVFIITVICAIVFLSYNGIGNISQFFILSILQILLNISFMCVVITFCLFIKNKFWGILITIIYIMFSPVTVYQLINFIGKKILRIDSFSLVELLPYGNIFQLKYYSPNTDLIRALISSIIFIFITYLLSLQILNKKDIL